jgi:hypothetical protein
MGVDAPGFDTVAGCRDVVDSRDHVLRKRQELGDYRLSVGGKGEVFVVHLKTGGEEISARVLKAHDNRDIVGPVNRQQSSTPSCSTTRARDSRPSISRCHYGFQVDPYANRACDGLISLALAFGRPCRWREKDA